MIKQILFDCGGVLVELNFRELMLKLSGSQEITEYFMNRIWHPDSPWLRYDSGELNTDEVKEELKKFMPEQYHTYLEEFVERLPEALPVMEGMEPIVDALQAHGYPCYLLSNFSERFEVMPERTPVLKKLDGMVVSYQLRMLKPDPQIYLRTAQILGINLEETLFVDDNLHNIEASEKVGMTGFQFKNPDDFRAYLQEKGILPPDHFLQ